MGSKIYWRHSAAGKVIEFRNTPFIIGEKKDLHCQLGDHYFSKRSSAPRKSTPVECVQLTKDNSNKQQCSDQSQHSKCNKQSQCSEQPPCTEQGHSKKSRPKLSLQGTRKIGRKKQRCVKRRCLLVRGSEGVHVDPIYMQFNVM